jgi:hypothetical protein
MVHQAFGSLVEYFEISGFLGFRLKPIFLFTIEASMRHAIRNLFLCLTIVASALLVLCSGCGGSASSTPPAPTTLTVAQTTAVATQMEETFVAASAKMGASWCGIPQDPTEDYPCTIPVNVIGTCSGGGTVAIAGSISGAMDYSDTGDATALITATPTNCAIPGTTLVINGSPDLSVSGTVFYFYGGVSNFTVTEAGSVTYGPKPTGTCQTNLTIAASFIGDSEHTVRSCTLTGTACGQAINQSCM